MVPMGYLLTPDEIALVDCHQVIHSGWATNTVWGNELEAYTQVCCCGWGEWGCVGTKEEVENDVVRRMSIHIDVLNG